MSKPINIFILFICVSVGFTSFTPKQKNVLVEGDLSVIVNAKGAPSDIGMPKLKKILKGEQQRWDDGTKILLALMKTSTGTGMKMTAQVYLMTNNELNKYFLAQVFQGKMSSPEFFDSETDLINYVKTKPGAIGIISTVNASGITVLSVDGKKSL